MKQFHFSFFGEPIYLQTDSEAFAESLSNFFNIPFTETFSTGRKPLPSHIRVQAGNNNGAEWRRSLPGKTLDAVQQLAAAVNHRFLFLHGCTIATDDCAVTFCGPSGAGKTTLAMVAHTLGYDVLGEDISIVDWRNGTVLPLPLPYRPRPVTRRFITSLMDGGGNRKNELAYRPRRRQPKRRLRRLFVCSPQTGCLEAVMRSIFRHSDQHAAEEINRVVRLLSGCWIYRCAPVRFGLDTTLAELAAAFDRWFDRDPTAVPWQAGKIH